MAEQWSPKPRVGSSSLSAPAMTTESEEELPAHLTPMYSDRGFSQLPFIPSVYGGHTRVYESSSAEHARIWMASVSPTDFNEWTRQQPASVEDYKGELIETHMHFDVAEARKLADQLNWMCDNHYHHAYEEDGDDEDE